jgi:hypothetical protein
MALTSGYWNPIFQFTGVLKIASVVALNTINRFVTHMIRDLGSTFRTQSLNSE